MPKKPKPRPAGPPKFVIEKKFIAQVRYYEELYLVRDNMGERVYAGSEETARKVLRLLNQSKGKSVKKRR